jgi:hypothetical protein
VRLEWAEVVARIAAEAPPLTSEQKTRIRILLAGRAECTHVGLETDIRRAA